MKKIMILAAFAAFTLTSCVGVLNQEPMSSDVVGSDGFTNPTYRLGQLAKIYGSFNITGTDGVGKGRTGCGKTEDGRCALGAAAVIALLATAE